MNASCQAELSVTQDIKGPGTVSHQSSAESGFHHVHQFVKKVVKAV